MNTKIVAILLVVLILASVALSGCAKRAADTGTGPADTGPADTGGAPAVESGFSEKLSEFESTLSNTESAYNEFDDSGTSEELDESGLQ